MTEDHIHNSIVEMNESETLDHLIHESALWTSDVDYWLDETFYFQAILNQADHRALGKAELKSMAHLQNIVMYYSNDVLIDLKSRIFHHREHMQTLRKNSTGREMDTLTTHHANLENEIKDLEGRMKEYKGEVLSFKREINNGPEAPFVHIKHVLIPTDFSENASKAVDYALSIFGKGVEKITLLHVFYTPTPSNLGYRPAGAASQRNTSSEEFEQEISRIEKNFPDLIEKVQTQFHVGKLNHWVDHVIEEEDIDLMIMGTKGTGQGRDYFGSNTSRMIKNIHIPLLVIPLEAPLLPPKQLMFATDLETSHRPKGMDVLQCIAKQYSAELHVVHIDSEMQPINSVHERKRERETLQELGLEGHQVEYISAEDTLEGVNDFVKDQMIDIVSTMTHHEGFIRSLFSKSTTKQIVLHSHIPILVMHDNG